MDWFWQLLTVLLYLVIRIVYHPIFWVLVIVLAFIIGYRMGH